MIDKVRLFLLVTLLASCTPLWNAANRNALETDVLEVLHRATESPPDLQCRMIDGTRSGYCLLETGPETVKVIAESLDLDQRVADFNDPGTIPPLVSEGKVGCLSREVFGDMDGLPAYWSGGRPAQLELSNGGQFEYLLLLFDVGAHRGCIQVSYAYG